MGARGGGGNGVSGPRGLSEGTVLAPANHDDSGDSGDSGGGCDESSGGWRGWRGWRGCGDSGAKSNVRPTGASVVVAGAVLPSVIVVLRSVSTLLSCSKLLPADDDVVGGEGGAAGIAEMLSATGAGSGAGVSGMTGAGGLSIGAGASAVAVRKMV